RLDHLARRQLDPLQRLLVVQRRRPPRRPVLEQRPQLVDLAQVLEVQLGDEVAAARPVGELALLLERGQRFAHRGEADPAPLGGLLLADPLAGPQLAGDDRPPQLLERVLSGGAGRLGGASGGGHRRVGVAAQRKASMPVSTWPITSAWTSAV